MSIARHDQSTKNNMFSIYLQYLKGNLKEDVDLLPDDKAQRFLQIYTIFLSACGRHDQITQNSIFAILLHCFKEQDDDGMQISMKFFCKLTL